MILILDKLFYILKIEIYFDNFKKIKKRRDIVFFTLKYKNSKYGAIKQILL